MSKTIVIDARIRRASTGRPVARLLEYLQKLDTENKYIVLLQPNDDWQPTAANFRVEDCDFPIFSFNPLQQLTFAQQLRRLKPDLVYFTMTGQQPLLYFGRQITLTHDLTMYEYVRAGRLPGWAHWLRMRGYRLLMWAAHRKAAKIIVPTNYVKDGLSKFHRFTANKIVVTYEASEPPLPVEGQPLHNVREPFIFHVGSPFPHKNIERLIKAFEILIKEMPDLQLVLPGKKEFYFEQLEREIISQSPARQNIMVPGFVSDEELKWLYEHARAYVLPSLSEGFGLPGLEAMAHGCPLVSSNATCLPEVYRGAAVYFDPTHVEDIAGKIITVISDDEIRKSLIDTGREQVKNFSWQKMSQEMLNVIKSA
jgi:glycosyltransferase involved in cell wall biosynthesis